MLTPSSSRNRDGCSPSSSADGHGGDDQALARARARDVEQPALLEEQLAGGDRRDDAVLADPVGLEQRRAAAQVRPALLLDVRDDHQPPLEALRAVRGEQAYGGAAGAPLGERVGGDLLLHQGREERPDADVVALLLGARGDVEQRADGVEVAVRAAGRTAAVVDRPAQPGRPAGARPQRPEQLLGRGTGAHLLARVDQQLGERLRAHHLGAVEPGEEARLHDRAPDQVARGPRRPALGLALLLLAGAQPPGEAAYVARVEAPERPEEQRLGPGGVEEVDVVGVVVVEVHDGAQCVEQRQHGGVADQRHLVAGHLDRHPGGAEGAAQRRDRRTPGAHQDRHLVPRDAVLEVRAPEQVGEVLGLGALGVERADQHPALAEVVGRRLGRQERGAGRLRDGARQREPAGHSLGGDEQPRAEPTGGAQGHDVGRRAVRARERGREVEDAAHLGAPEPVDRLVRVADDDQVAAVAGERPEERDLAGVGVLVLVDEHRADPGAQLVAVRLGLDGGAADQVGVVGGALGVEVGEVLVEEQPGRHELGQPLRRAQGAQLVAVQALLAGAGQHGVDLTREAAGAERAGQRLRPVDRLGVVGEQLAQHDVLLGSAEQPQRRFVELGRRVAADQPVGEGVERRAHRGGHGPAETGGDPVAELLGGLAGERQRQDLVGLGAAGLDPVDDRLDERRGLAGARPGEDQQRPALVVDDALLVLVEGGHVDRHVGPHEAVRRGSGRHVVIRPSRADSRSGARGQRGDHPQRAGALGPHLQRGSRVVLGRVESRPATRSSISRPRLDAEKASETS